MGAVVDRYLARFESSERPPEWNWGSDDESKGLVRGDASAHGLFILLGWARGQATPFSVLNYKLF